MNKSDLIEVKKTLIKESHVGSSFQFHYHYHGADAQAFVRRCADLGVELKWFGAQTPAGFTSKYNSWHYLGDVPTLPKTDAILATTFDLRVPLTFDVRDCDQIAEIIVGCCE